MTKKEEKEPTTIYGFLLSVLKSKVFFRFIGALAIIGGLAFTSFKINFCGNTVEKKSITDLDLKEKVKR